MGFITKAGVFIPFVDARWMASRLSWSSPLRCAAAQMVAPRTTRLTKSLAWLFKRSGFSDVVHSADAVQSQVAVG
jgi:hypothetical protein